MSDENWDEIRTAYQVAKQGTVSGAAEVLGVHHATVIRHIDALEERLGTKLFQRHPRGYNATEAGQDLMRVAAVTDDQFSQLKGRLKGQHDAIEGELTVTCPNQMDVWLAEPLTRLQRDHPGLYVNLLSDERIYRLEYGEAHVALRAGPKPQEPDNVVQLAGRFNVQLAASHKYVRQYGAPGSVEEFASHQFINAPRPAKPPFSAWLNDHIKDSQNVFRTRSLDAVEICVRKGMGIGFVRQLDDDLVQIMPPQPEWEVCLWLVTHVDLHRTTKVQSALQYIKQHFSTLEMT